ncbi:MAG: hypothetical protein H7175_16335, partial [Burkholderiales bacterium]|nr:hypothetical protein [Anaerolineae bacterium]
MMLRSMQKFALLLIVVLATVMAAWVGLLRARPYAEASTVQAELRAFLDCDLAVEASDEVLPCFLGLRPCETSLDDALTILSHHAWIAS